MCSILCYRKLDISQSIEKHGNFKNENQTLANIVESLPLLSSLDISGTNLAGTGKFRGNPVASNFYHVTISK